MSEALVDATSTGDVAQGYEAVIGLEVHAQLLTDSKMFCRCAREYLDSPPNSNCCPVCLGMPGALPVINKTAVRYLIRAALALNCHIARHTKFDRKNYFYADLPKGYQISQFDMPLSEHGHLTVDVNSSPVTCGITRIHLEEDTGTMHHVGELLHSAKESEIDFNRCGVPLMEIVSEPDLRSADEAREYLVALRQILIYTGVSDGNLETGSFRCDANVSVRPRGETELGVKVEVKNMNSFRSVHRAIEYEIERQCQVLAEGGTLHQETRGWVDAQSRTVSQRTKEYAADYRYFPEPDLPPMEITDEVIAEIRAELPEMAPAKLERYVSKLGLSDYEATILVSTPTSAKTFEDLCERGVSPAVAAKWLLGEVARLENETHTPVAASALGLDGLTELIGLAAAGTINGTTAKDLLGELFATGGSPASLVKERGLGVVADSNELTAIVETAIAANPKAAEDFRSGKEAALQSLVGGVMKATKGRADARQVTELLRTKLS